MTFEKLISYFFFDYRSKIQSIWFKRLLYIYLIIRTAQWLFHFELLFGENSIIYSKPQSIGFFKDLAFILYSQTEPGLSLVFLIALISISVFHLITTKFSFFGDVLIWFTVLNIHNKLYPSLTGGDLLLNQFLFFNCFISARFIKNETRFNLLRVCIHNVAVLGIILQLCLVYFLSGLAKVGDPEWLNGQAIISVAKIRHFSLYSFLSYNPLLDPLYFFLNYLVLFYQVLFPALVWIGFIKRPLLLIGIGMHVYIGFVMGLPEFSAIMIIAYVYFWPVKTSFT